MVIRIIMKEAKIPQSPRSSTWIDPVSALVYFKNGGVQGRFDHGRDAVDGSSGFELQASAAMEDDGELLDANNVQGEHNLTLEELLGEYEDEAILDHRVDEQVGAVQV